MLHTFLFFIRLFVFLYLCDCLVLPVERGSPGSRCGQACLRREEKGRPGVPAKPAR